MVGCHSPGLESTGIFPEGVLVSFLHFEWKKLRKGSVGGTIMRHVYTRGLYWGWEGWKGLLTLHGCFNWIWVFKMYLYLSFEAFLTAANDVLCVCVCVCVCIGKGGVEILYKRISCYQNASSPNSRMKQIKSNRYTLGSHWKIRVEGDMIWFTFLEDSSDYCLENVPQGSTNGWENTCIG